MGRYEAAIGGYRRAQERNPLSPMLHRQLAWAYYCAGRHGEAIAELEELRGRLGENPGWLRAAVASSYLETSRYSEAVAELEGAVVVSDSHPPIVAALATGYARAGRIADARRLVPWLEARSPGDLDPELHLALGDTGRALAIVEATFEKLPSAFGAFRCTPVYRQLRAEPRIRKIVEQLRFPD
jgi:tetratricopeptide (TPR) repeat protein